MCALKNVKEVELMGIGKLKKCVLMGGLKKVESVIMENAGKLESVKELKEVMEEERKKREEEERKRREMIALAKTTVNVRNVEDLKNINCYVGVIVIASNCCNDGVLLDLSRFVNLRELKVGDECFQYTYRVRLIGLSQLERVVIGKNCFTKHKNYRGWDSDRHFYLKNCERLRQLKMGRYSFSDYYVCEIENVPCLEVIEMGELDESSYNFHYASLILKNMPSLKSLLFGDYAFMECYRV
ncbi:hypothetical protein WA577_005750, partial [Blastocystis sp. JDR]